MIDTNPHNEADLRPVVALPAPGLPGAAIAIGAGVAALLLFGVLEARRDTRAVAPPSARSAFVAPPPLAVPPEPAAPVAVAAAPVRVIMPVAQAPRAPIIQSATPIAAPAPYIALPTPAPSPPLPERTTPVSNDTALVIDAGVKQAAEAVTGVRNPGVPTATPAAGGDDSPARASVMANRSTVITAGTMIPAVLETPIDTARPGLLRAIVAGDTRGFDAQKILIPRGSRLIGEYQADVRSGQNRVLVNWTQLIRPDGVSIRLGSPAADSLGGAGIPGRVHSYFFARFASAVLQSALAVGVNLASRPANNTVVVGLAGNGVSSTVGQSLLPNDLRPKITVKQGAQLSVFVSRDLDFAGTPSVR